MNPILLILSLLDCLVAITLLGGSSFFLFKMLGDYLAYAILIKGVFSLLASFSVGYYLDWMGFLDCLAGIMLVLMLFGINPPFLKEITFLYSFKAIYTTVRTVFNF